MSRLSLALAVVWPTVEYTDPEAIYTNTADNHNGHEGAGAVVATVRAIQNRSPRFSWQLASQLLNQTQVAYRIIAGVTAGSDDAWDSGIVYSQDSVHIVWGGRALSSREVIYWTVSVIPSLIPSGEECWVQSDVAQFEMGLLDSSDWEDRFLSLTLSYGTLIAGIMILGQILWPVMLSVPPMRARLYISGLGFYRAFIDGQLVNPLRLDVPQTNYFKRVFYDTYDLTTVISLATKHVLGIELGNGFFNPLPLQFWGSLNLRDYLAVGERPQLIAQLEIQYTGSSTQVFYTAPCKNMQTESCWTVGPGPYTANDIYLGVIYDSRLETPDWVNYEFDATTWELASAAPPSALDDLSLLEANSIPPIIAESTPLQAVSTWLSPGSTSIYVANMGKNFAGIVRLQISLQGIQPVAGASIKLRYGELLYSDGSLNVMTSVAGQIKGRGVGGPCAPDVAYQTDSYILNGSEEAIDFLPSFTWHGFQYVEVDMSALGIPLTTDMLSAYVIHADVRSNGVFECSSEVLNQIWSMFQTTLLSNLMAVQSDCPHRERFGYGGDLLATSESGMLTFDMSQFYAKRLSDFSDDQRQNGGFTECAPYNGIADHGFGDGSGPVDWQSVFPQLALEQYQYYGNLLALQLAYPYAKDFIQLMLSNLDTVQNGLGDWMTIEPSPTQLTGLGILFADLVAMSQIASILGFNDESEDFLVHSTEISDMINSQFFDETLGLYAAQDNSWNGTQCAQSMPLYMGITPTGSISSAYNNLLLDIAKQDAHLACGMFGIKWVLLTLSDMGATSTALQMAEQKSYPSFGYMLDQGASTIWESWFYSDNTYSHNHPMFGSVAQWVMSSLAGIHLLPSSVAFNPLVIAPRPSLGLSYVSASYTSIRGDIVCSWTLDEATLLFDMNVTIPHNTIAYVYVPTDLESHSTMKTLGGGSYSFQSKLVA
ncbi:glycoside hydrolase family 78 [Pelomyxa schiedti]|nr:glycoside hydrolase family 78 [Pelomyxa schiedti]